jgi:alkylation response protein AidB-like acyl-CoA dehydrogenase
MDFSWSDALEERREALLKFARETLTADIASNDPVCGFSEANWKRCSDIGVFGYLVPEAYGGSGLSALETVRLLETLGYGCEDTGLVFAISSQMLSIQPSIQVFGSPEMKTRYLSQLAGGAKGAFAITENESGSDTYSLKTTAEKVDGGYVLNGGKKYITLAPVADMAVIFASTHPDRGQWGISAFLVERGQKGFETSATQAKMGLRSTPIGDIELSDCFVPEENRIGAEGAGVAIFAKAMESERSYILASQLGTMERQLELAIDYARNRRQFGKPIGKNQSVANRIADMKLRLETSRLLLYKVAWLEDQGQPLLMEAALANLQMSEAFVDSSLDAVRTFGARGYLTEYGIERDLRDSVGGLIYSGTSDIQRNIIARTLGL